MVSSLGQFGVEQVFSPMCLTSYLTFGPVAANGDVTVRVVYDHRAMDGREMARASSKWSARSKRPSPTNWPPPAGRTTSQGATMASKRPAPANYWRDDKCAKAFWRQDEIPAYRELYADTAAWLDPRPGERWLDLGCGAGRLSKAVWDVSGGTVAEVVGIDCAAKNAEAYAKLREKSAADRLRFECVDFSAGLPWPGDGLFDGAVSGLAIQYAEHFSEAEGRWTTDNYDRLLRDVNRVLKPGGRFVFSVNVPEPKWGKLARHALRRIWNVPRKLKYLQRMWRLGRYGSWLTREARLGRFHYLPADDVARRLTDAGFAGVEHRTSFVGQAYVFRCRKSLPAVRAA